MGGVATAEQLLKGRPPPPAAVPPRFIAPGADALILALAAQHEAGERETDRNGGARAISARDPGTRVIMCTRERNKHHVLLIDTVYTRRGSEEPRKGAARTVVGRSRRRRARAARAVRRAGHSSGLYIQNTEYI